MAKRPGDFEDPYAKRQKLDEHGSGAHHQYMMLHNMGMPPKMSPQHMQHVQMQHMYPMAHPPPGYGYYDPQMAMMYNNPMMYNHPAMMMPPAGGASGQKYARPKLP